MTAMTAMPALIPRLPKAELHIHIEGSLEPAMLVDLAKRNGVALPYASVDAVRAAYQFTQLQDFLDIYYQGMAVLRTEQDFYDLTTAYLRRAAADGVAYVELFFDPQGHLERGIDFATVIGGIHRATSEAVDVHGVTARIIMCFLRHLEADDAERTLDLALAHQDKIIGVGLDSTEVGHPPSKFRAVFERARAAGFRLTAHAGEEGPPDYVWEAIDVLGVERIDHGNRALEDAALTRRIAKDAIPLTVCPLSNLKLCVVDAMADHPIRRMLEAGLVATVNSDDPAYFGGYINDNYAALHQAIGLTAAEATALARNSFAAAFLPEAVKSAALEHFDAAAAVA